MRTALRTREQGCPSEKLHPRLSLGPRLNPRPVKPSPYAVVDDEE